MPEVSLLFPGQGSQYVGMGDELQKSHKAQEIFQAAHNALGISIQELCSKGPQEKLTLTENTQPALLTHSIASLEKLRLEHKLNVKYVMGHSVGEYAALVAAGVLNFQDAIRAVKLRGKAMQEATPAGRGKMFAILRVPHDIVHKACEEVSSEQAKVMCANYNDPTQVVISGHGEACEKAVLWLKENYPHKQMAKELKVSAPFHSSLMKPAEKKLAEFLATIEFKKNTIPYIANIDAKIYPVETSGDTIRENLIKQVCGSVLWSQSLGQLPDNSKLLEIGPGKVLSGLCKRINKTYQTFATDQCNQKDLEDFLK